MIYKEEEKNLFLDTKDYCYAQCISADFVMGAGIAVEFNKRMNMKNILKKKYDNYLKQWDSHFEETIPCIFENNVFNLITKRNVYMKPTYNTLENALIGMKALAQINGVTKIAMPLIGCGLDRLEWSKVSTIIQTVFEDTDIELLICKYRNKNIK